ncbi:MAG: DUF2760 domain-containing protein [Candidatus Binatia bacterium]|nr:DUF2760 domain-containing protein [Candidatus Binatia bacterium]
MAARARFHPVAFLAIILLSGGMAGGNYWLFTATPFGLCTLGPVGDWSQSPCLPYLSAFVGVPLVVGLLLLIILPALVTVEPTETGTKAPAAPLEPRPPATPPPPTRPAADAAVQLLALLQREGRLVDFLREDLQPYDDAQIGAAVRSIHQGCRQVLADHITLEPVLAQREGEEITIPRDFDPSAIRLTGNVSGDPPFRGTVRHPGWRATHVRLPTQPSGQDPEIVAPAEVEIP